MTLQRTTLLNVAGIWQFANWPYPVEYDTITYQTHSFFVRQEQTGTIYETKAVIDIDDARKEMVDESRTNGLTGETVTLLHVERENGGAWALSETYHSFSLDIAECYGRYPEIVLEITAAAGWKRTPGLPTGKKTCGHVFKGVRCQYAGVDLTCLRDREHCRLIKNNLRHFGGWFFAPEGGEQIRLPSSHIIPSSPRGGRLMLPELGGDSGTAAESATRDPNVRRPGGRRKGIGV